MSNKRSWCGQARRRLRKSAKSRNLELNISSAESKVLFHQPCYYCGLPRCGGLDRLNPALGYNIENCVPACTKCNFILGDLPKDAKMEMRAALRSIREKKLIDNWEPASIIASRAYNAKKKQENAEPQPESRFIDLYA